MRKITKQDLLKEFRRVRNYPLTVTEEVINTIWSVEPAPFKKGMVKSLIKSRLNKDLIAVETAKSSRDKLLIEKKISLYRDIFKAIEGVTNLQEISETIEDEKIVYRSKIEKLQAELSEGVFCSDSEKEQKIEKIKKVLDKLGAKAAPKVYNGDLKSYIIDKASIPDGATLSNVKFTIEDLFNCDIGGGNSRINASGMPSSIQIGIDKTNKIYNDVYDCIVNSHEVKKGNKITLALGSLRIVNNMVVVKATAKAI